MPCIKYVGIDLVSRFLFLHSLINCVLRIISLGCGASIGVLEVAPLELVFQTAGGSLLVWRTRHEFDTLDSTSAFLVKAFYGMHELMVGIAEDELMSLTIEAVTKRFDSPKDSH